MKIEKKKRKPLQHRKRNKNKADRRLVLQVLGRGRKNFTAAAPGCKRGLKIKTLKALKEKDAPHLRSTSRGKKEIEKGVKAVLF